MLNLAKKIGLKTRNLSSALVKEYIQSIWANKTIGQLYALFKEKPDWWSVTTVIYFQPSVRNVKKQSTFLYSFVIVIVRFSCKSISIICSIRLTTKICSQNNKYPPVLRRGDYSWKSVMKVIKYPLLLKLGNYSWESVIKVIKYPPLLRRDDYG